jgi:hypothetical protein
MKDPTEFHWGTAVMLLRCGIFEDDDEVHLFKYVAAENSPWALEQPQVVEIARRAVAMPSSYPKEQ